MPPKEMTTFRLDGDLSWGLRIIRARDGLGVSEQIRRAVEDWLRRHGATQPEIHRAFDDFETGMTAASNRGGNHLAELKLPEAFGERLARRRFGTLSDSDMALLDELAGAAGRKTKAHRDFWQRAIRQFRKGTTE